jgi:serine/threonine-protein kinase RsbT
MTTYWAPPDAAGQAVDVLREYLPPPVARALVATVARRSKADGPGPSPEVLANFLGELERALAAHILEARRREACAEQLRKLGGRNREGRATPTPTPTSDRLAPPSAKGSPMAGLMEAGPTFVRVRNADDVGAACDVGRDLARRLGFSNVQQTKIATAIAELARNIILYAMSGEVRISATKAPRAGIEVLAVDEGPGIASIEHVMSGAYKSRSGMGMGLRGAKRLMDTFEIESSPRGTSVLVRKFVQP